jgi:2,4-dienoyl-CoA reductase-like NADH-dependent reductase (Old Yellow Enzyme family)
VYIGGAASRAAIDEALGHGFVAVAMARALIRDPGFVRRLAEAEGRTAGCDHCNYCAARIYTTSMACHHRDPPPLAIRRHLVIPGVGRDV